MAIQQWLHNTRIVKCTSNRKKTKPQSLIVRRILIGGRNIEIQFYEEEKNTYDVRHMSQSAQYWNVLNTITRKSQDCYQNIKRDKVLYHIIFNFTEYCSYTGLSPQRKNICPTEYTFVWHATTECRLFIYKRINWQTDGYQRTV